MTTRTHLQGSYDPREYCVQYRESDFNFVSRLMEQYGIFYFFKHEQGKHTLVLADSPTAHSSCPGQSSVRHVTVSGGPQEDVITGWRIEQELRTGKYSHTDYNFQTPSTSLMVSEPTVYEVGGNSKFEIYDYFGEHLTKGAGQVSGQDSHAGGRSWTPCCCMERANAVCLSAAISLPWKSILART